MQPPMPEMEYHVFDHLGNTRVVYTVDYIRGLYDYSAYGRVSRQFVAGGIRHRFKSTAHERDLETGYDYRGARWSDPGLGRFLSVDPLAALAPGWTPYRAFYCNPIYFVDHDGRIEWPLQGAKALNKSDVKGGGWNLTNTIIRTSPYGDKNRGEGMTKPHIGIDYRAAEGTEFYSLGDGRVVDIGETSKGAKFIQIEYSGGDKVRFLHLESTTSELKIGSNVKEGQYLGFTGKSGTKIAHLHIDAVNSKGESINPEGKNYGKYTNEEFFGDCKECDTKTKLNIIYQRIENIQNSIDDYEKQNPLE